MSCFMNNSSVRLSIVSFGNWWSRDPFPLKSPHLEDTVRSEYIRHVFLFHTENFSLNGIFSPQIQLMYTQTVIKGSPHVL